MKNKLSIFGAVIVIACTAVFFNGCSSTATQRSTQNWGSFGEVLVPVKDFESKGLVFTEISFTVTDNGKINGKAFTYQELLKAAQKVGADAIVNVTIDRLVESVTGSVSSFSTSSSSTKETWYGSALAIKYTGALTQSSATASPNRERSFNGASSSSSEQSSSGQKANIINGILQGK